ncbi:Uncharacterised protein g8106 [Pycnogonum litorale]
MVPYYFYSTYSIFLGTLLSITILLLLFVMCWSYSQKFGFRRRRSPVKHVLMVHHLPRFDTTVTNNDDEHYRILTEFDHMEHPQERADSLQNLKRDAVREIERSGQSNTTSTNRTSQNEWKTADDGPPNGSIYTTTPSFIQQTFSTVH